MLKDPGLWARLPGAATKVSGKPAFSFSPFLPFVGFVCLFNLSLQFKQPFIILTAFPIDSWDLFDLTTFSLQFLRWVTTSNFIQSTLISKCGFNPDIQPTRTRADWLHKRGAINTVSFWLYLTRLIWQVGWRRHPLGGVQTENSTWWAKVFNCHNVARSQFQTAQYILENNKDGLGSGSTDSLGEFVKYPNCESRFRINWNVMNSLTVPSPSKNEDLLNENGELNDTKDCRHSERHFNLWTKFLIIFPLVIRETRTGEETANELYSPVKTDSWGATQLVCITKES